MANKIYVDTQLLEDLGEQIRQLQRSLDSVNGEITRSLSEVRRVASSQDQLIRKMQTVGQNTRKTSDHAGKLANAVIYAAKLWEEAEKKIHDTDKRRAEYVRTFTGRDWQCADDYDLCIDSSRMDWQKCIRIVKAYLECIE